MCRKKTTTTYFLAGSIPIFAVELLRGLDPLVSGCASSDCMGRVINAGRSCYTFDGDHLDERRLDLTCPKLET
jgi:hypothetical protein